jgi:hypothetical protein
MTRSESAGGEKAPAARKGLPRHYYTPRPVRDVDGLTRRERDEFRDLVSGTAEVLIASGLLSAEMLPLPGKVGIAWRPDNGEPQPGGSWSWVPGYLEVRRRPDGSFCVVVTVSAEEQARRRAQLEGKEEADARAKMRRERDMRRAKGWLSEGDAAKRELASMFTSHEAFRNWYADRLYGLMEAHIGVLNECACLDGYDITQETTAEFLEELQEALDVVRDGSSVFNPAKRAARVQKLKATIAAEDDDFQPFLSKLVSERAEPSNG